MSDTSYTYSRHSLMGGFRCFWRTWALAVTSGYLFMTGWYLGFFLLTVGSAVLSECAARLWRALP